MTRDQVRRALGVTPEPFQRVAGPREADDLFEALGVVVYYDEASRCEAVEASPPCALRLHGRDLLGRPFAEVRAWIRTFDPDPAMDAPEQSGLTSRALGLGVWAPGLKEGDEAPVESAIVFADGYRD